MPSPISHIAHMISKNNRSAAAGSDAPAGQETGGAEVGTFLLLGAAAISVASMAIVRARRYFRGAHEHAEEAAPTPRGDASQPPVPEHRVVIGETLRLRTPSGEAARAAEELVAPVVAAAPARAVSPQQPVPEVRVAINGDSSPEPQDSPAVGHVARLASPSVSSVSSRASSVSPDIENGGSWVKLARAEEGVLSLSSGSESESSRSASPLLGGSRSLSR